MHLPAGWYGSLLLQACLEDAQKRKVDGVAAVTSRGTRISGSNLFAKHGVGSVNSAPPSFELMVKKIGTTVNVTSLFRFRSGWEKHARACGKRLAMIRADQGPCIAKAIAEIAETTQGTGILVRAKELTTARRAQQASCANGIFNVVVNPGVFAEHPISRTRCKSIMKQVRNRAGSQ